MANESPEHREARLAKQRATERTRRNRNPDKHREKNARARSRHREKWNAAKCAKRAADADLVAANRRNVAAWREKNVEYAREFRRKRHAKNKEAYNAISRGWHARNRERANVTSRSWYAANRVKAAAHARERRKNSPSLERARYRTDIVFRLTKCMRHRLWAAVTRGRGHKSATTFALIGCTPDFLRTHLEALFEPLITWENYGSFWHVDHIINCAAFDLTDPAKQRACFHYSNLRPLGAAENLARRRHRRHYGGAVT